jgi:autophagy-related protein 16
MTTLEEIHNKILERNALETNPFVSVYSSNATLWKQVDALQKKCNSLEHDLVIAKEDESPNKAAKAALKNEARLRDKVEKLQQELNDKLRAEADESSKALKAAQELAELKEKNAKQQEKITELMKESEKALVAIQHLEEKLDDAKSTAKLAEIQYDGLKATIRSLQEENDELKKENRVLVDRTVNEKEKASDQLNILNEMVDKLKKEVDMLRSLKVQEEKRRSWFGKASVNADHEVNKHEKSPQASHQRWGSMGVILPSGPKQIIKAHAAEISGLRYDSTGSDLIATASSDNTVKVFDTSNGICKATLRGGSGHAMTCCDLGGGVVVGGSTDKTCRVWNLRTERMIHQLAGHAHKITCVRLIGGEKAILSGSADRSMKVWDITRSTYRQTTTLRHSSTTYCLDVGNDTFTAVSGHMDGGLRFWDLRTGDRTGDISGLHEHGITSVQFHPTNALQVLTNGKDSSVKVTDVRTCTALQTLRHEAFQTGFQWSTASFSPDGTYAAAGSSISGEIFVWRVLDGKLEKTLKAHSSGVGCLAWGRGAQQVASADRSGNLVLWA